MGQRIGRDETPPDHPLSTADLPNPGAWLDIHWNFFEK
jgi:hypothetical protein